MTTRTLRAAAACALLATTCLASPALAQNMPSAFKNIDGNGVDLTDGSFNFSMLEGSIGAGEGALELIRYNAAGSSLDSWSSLSLHRFGFFNNVLLRINNRTELFKLEKNGFVSAQANGTTLSGSGRSYTYRAADGTEIFFGDPAHIAGQNSSSCSSSTSGDCSLVATRVNTPNGKSVSLAWEARNGHTRLTGVSNNLGYAMNIGYASGPQPGTAAWKQRTSVTFRNTAAGVDTSTVSYAYPSATETLITLPDDRQWRITTATDGKVTGIKRPGASADSTTVAYGPNGVTSVTDNGVTTTYARTVDGNVATTITTDVLKRSSTVVSDLTLGRPKAFTDALNRVTKLEYDTAGRPISVTAPEGNQMLTTYDARGNIVKLVARTKDQATANDIVTEADFPSNCLSVATCNQPLWTKDAAGKQTDFTYNAAGQVTTVRAPAPKTDASRPETRYSYRAVNGVSLLTTVSACSTGESCVNSVDEVRTTIDYALANGLPSSVSTGSGNGSVSATTAMTYDAAGNLVNVDGPLSGPADTSRTYYNAAREVVGVIGPDPDGAGPLRHRAQDLLRNADGQVIRVHGGTANGIGDADLAGMSAVNASHAVYDVNGRKVSESSDSAGVVTGVTHYSYDAKGRLDCAATRMNPGAFQSSSGACVPSINGAFGPDRIVRTSYDELDRSIRTEAAVGTPDQKVEAAVSYTANGALETLIDGQGNKTAYTYDGHDRLIGTYYPVVRIGAESSNPADYEALNYDSRGNVTKRRLRDGKEILYAYDDLGRLSASDVPNLAYFENDTTYSYDNLGRLTAASYGEGLSVQIGYDALGRKVSEGSNWYGTTYSQYDPAGRRTRLTYRDGFAVGYDYLVTGEMAAIREVDGITLASFVYDQLGLRISLTRGNGAVTRYAYDPGYRLNNLVHDLAGTERDLTSTFDYNPASQIAANTRSNDAYAHVRRAGDLATPVNGLNQVTGVAGASTEHDGRGNMTFDGVRSYGYTTENRLSAAPGTNLGYDPLGRLIHITSSKTDFLYDGDMLIGEVEANGGPSRRRFVHGPATDEPLVAYDGAGNRRYLHADERGSIVAVSDQAGNPIAIGRYDEYGQSKDVATDRFGYTGQITLSEIGLSSYKARMYHPKLGRFMQTDPIGYGAGMNLYGYVGGDPVNRLDPTGMCDEPTDTHDSDGNLCIVVTATREKAGSSSGGGGGNAAALRSSSGNGSNSSGSTGGPVAPRPKPQNAVMRDDCGGATLQPAAALPPGAAARGWRGTTLGLNPQLGGNAVQSDFPGTVAQGRSYYEFLRAAKGDIGPSIPIPFTGIERSFPSGITFRVGGDGDPRIEIPADTFNLNVRERIHIRGPQQCRIK